MPSRYTTRILEHLKHSTYRPARGADIARDMRVEDDDRPAFDDAIAQLTSEGALIADRDDRLRLPSFPSEIEGRLRINPRGFGFVIPDRPYRDGDLFVPAGGTRDAISGDRVRAKVIEQKGRGKPGRDRSPYIGRVEEVIERGQERFVGKLAKEGKQWLVEPDGRLLHDPVVVRDPHAKNAKLGDKVVLELLHYPDDNYLAEGVIIEVLGEAGRPDVETRSVIEAHGLREAFDDAVHEETRQATRAFDEIVARDMDDREDLRATFIFTIDPPDARDFDDAISIEHDSDQEEWILGVHIADVATFVEPGTALDDEASARGNSVYLPRHVIPMLPELLSNGICSLQEGVDRLTKSVFITFDRRGRVVNQRVCASVIRSRKRLTYLEAQALIDGDSKTARQHTRAEPVYEDELIDRLRLADRLARILQKRRRDDGAIVLDLPDVELVFDDDGHVIDAVPEDDAFTHTLIEMFMVEANEALARLFSSLNVAVLRRTHPQPVAGDLAELQMYVRAVNRRIPESPTRFDLQKLLEATRDHPASRAVHFAVLRTLTKATYSPAMVGHFALASDHYLHFTSPIRRYPDLLVHRALQAFLDLTDNGQKVPGGKKRASIVRRMHDDERVPDEGRLIELGNHCTETEIEAEQAERELRSFLVMQFLEENHLGDVFDGVITGVTNTGVFVSIERFLIEGLVRTEDLPSSSAKADRWRTDQATGRLVAQRSGVSLGIGDAVTVRILAVDLSSRRLSLELDEVRARAKDASDETRVTGPAKGERWSSKPNRGKGKGGKGKKGGGGRRGR